MYSVIWNLSFLISSYTNSIDSRSFLNFPSERFFEIAVFKQNTDFMKRKAIWYQSGKVLGEFHGLGICFDWQSRRETSFFFDVRTQSETADTCESETSAGICLDAS